MIHIIAHRGASAYEPENTLRAFERAIDMGATVLELDIHLSRDGHPIVIHDAELSRTTNGTGRVDDLPLEVEVIELARGRAQLYVELKGQRTPEPVVEALRAGTFVDQALAGSFYPWLIQKVKFLEPAVRTSMLVRRKDRGADFLEWALAVEADYVHPCWEDESPTPHKLVTPAMIADIRRRGLGIILWHEERPEELRELARLDVDGICTDTPDVLSRFLKEI
jgi:glycerophosphoryl diester phosphodiesterase